MEDKLIEEIRNALQQWLIAFNSNKIENVIKFYDSSIVFANQSNPIVVGLTAMKESLKRTFAVKPKLSFKEEQLIVVEGLGYAASQYEMTGTTPQDGSKIHSVGRVVAIFRKDNSDQWKLVFDMDNSPPDVKK